MNEPKNSLRSIFDEAAELDDAGERAAFLQQACGDDAELRGKIADLLRAHKQPGGFLDTPVPGAAQKTIPAPPTEKPGDRIGRYKLLEQIGEGGCGTVYMAEQEEPVRRRVALKVIKLGMDTKSVIARFEAERQALALMDHPNIAKVLDAGATDTGRPYFVMELVRGIKITDYCDQNNLPTGQRLALFNQVCHAIQHAHQKGIIHRDIKPSNILVTLHDGVPVPKVIDFGIAKATTGQRLTDKTIFTAFEQFIGTPAYMSPEQAEMSGLDVDTRSDIYALGILLYELLTGRPPFDPRELLAAGLDAMRRTIREKEPARPSTRLSTMLAADRTTVAKHRQSDPAKLSSLIRGDLDWIVMKALEKDRTRRYETASGFASDIQRHLNHEPVAARPPTNLYRFQKLFRRNKLAFAAASAVLVALIIGLGLSTWLFLKEKDARQRAVTAEKEAQAEARKSRQVARFLEDMLDGVAPSVALGRDTAMLREILDKTAQRVASDLAGQPEVQVEIRSTLAWAYHDLGLYNQMERMARETLRLAGANLGEEHWAVADACLQLGDALTHLGNFDEAETFTRKALALRGRIGSENVYVANSLNGLANVLFERGLLIQAETMHREVLAMTKRLRGAEHPNVANTLNNLAAVLHKEGRLDEAGAIHREALAMRKKLRGNEHPEVANSLHNLAGVLADQNRLAEAETLYREAVALRRKFLGSEHPELTGTLAGMASVLHREGKLAEAESLQREALTIRSKQPDNHPPDAANLAGVLHDQGKLDEAESLYREALAAHQKVSNSEDPELAKSLSNLAVVLQERGKLIEAEPMQREALRIRRKLFGNEHIDVANSLNNLALVLRDQDKLAEAETMHREALDMTRKLLGDEHPTMAYPLGNLATVLQREGKFAEAEPLYREALTINRKSAANNPPALEGPIYELAENLYRQSKFAEAEPLYREALASRRARLAAEHEGVLSFTASLARLLAGWAWTERASKPVSEIAGRSREAEHLLRDCLAIRERDRNLTHWRIADVKSRLGEALMSVAATDPTLGPAGRLAHLAEAEPLLLEGNERLQQSKSAGIKYQRDALVRLVRLYETWDELIPEKDMAAQATGWKKKLSEFDNAGTEGKPAATE